jgi:hypothetical protein
MKIKVRPGVPHKMDTDDNRTFDQWMQAVDLLLSRCRGVSAYDLPDCPYRDWYDDGVRPIRAANRALANFVGEEC